MVAVVLKEKAGASEERNVEEALAALAATEESLPGLLRRIRAHMTLEPGAAVLDIGAAQGAYVTALTRAGFAARGVEPWKPAIATGRELSARTGVETDIVEGFAESLPYEDESFDLVIAMSVMEHVVDPDQVFREAYRVLKPGGGFYFYTGSNLGIKQVEIQGFPLFAWYPDKLRRRIMAWAVEKRPHLVGYTKMPAIHWFSPRTTPKMLAAAGFRKSVDIWNLVDDSELSGKRLKATQLARTNRLARFAGYVVNGSIAYLSVK
jgi:SAM-dependent methyltransferase